jgi:hypothetical protein
VDIEALVKEAHTHWLNGDPYKAGDLLYDHIPVAERPAWAAKILSVAKDYLNIHIAEIERLLTIAATPETWPEAYDVFHSLRKQTLATEKSHGGGKDHDIHVFLLLLAENVAKVIYNASGKTAPFDHDSGQAVVLTAAGVAEHLGDLAFSEYVWKAISSRDFLKSDQPVAMCNPHCSVCLRKSLGRWKNTPNLAQQ